MPQRIQIKIGQFVNGRGLSEALSSENVQAVVTQMLELQRGRVLTAFTDGGHHRRGGSKWALLAESTQKRKARTGKTTLLIDTGRLRNTIRSQIASASDERIIGQLIADAPYAGFHQDGTSRMPKRRVIEVTKSDIAKMREFLKQAITRLING